MPLAPGLTASVTLVVAEADTAIALHSGDVPVLGTPRVIALAEQASIEAIAGELPADRTTVGYQVQLAHLTPTAIGGTVVAEATLEQVEGRRLTFRVSVDDARGLVAAGRITRVVVERSRFLDRAQFEGAMSSEPSEPVLIVERADGFATLTLNRPSKRNALSVQLRDAISDALDGLATEPEIRAVVITGAGPAFSAGFDLSEFERAANDEAFGRELWASSDRYHETVLRFPLPTVAAVNGMALAGGFDLAVLCDIRVAASTARFAHPERTFGDVVYGPLHDLVGGAIARELTIGGRELDADEAHALHLVGQVVPPEVLMATTRELVTRIIAAPRDLLMRTKAKALRRAGFAPGAESTGTLDL